RAADDAELVEPADPVEPTPPEETVVAVEGPTETPADDAVKPVAPMAELDRERRRLEAELLGAGGPAAAAELPAAWHALADVYAKLGSVGEAAGCRVVGLWELDGESAAAKAGFAAWYRTEGEGRRDHRPPALDRWLADAAAMSTAGAASFCSLTAWAGFDDGCPAAALLAERVGPTAALLRRFEGDLPIRAVWLAWAGLARRSGDPLLLAQARDRLLERLFDDGLRGDVDLPVFIRETSDAASSGDARSAGRSDSVDRLRSLAGLVRSWCDLDAPDPDHPPPTAAYADLLLAFGLARLGADVDARALTEQARSQLAGRDAVHAWLAAAFEHRIEQVASIEPATWPAALQQRLDGFVNHTRYKIDKLRENSRVLEPHERLDAYAQFRGRGRDDLDRQLRQLAGETDRSALGRSLTLLLATLDDAPSNGESTAGTRPSASTAGASAASRLLAATLDLGPRAGEQVADAALARAAAFVDGGAPPLEQAALIERSLFLTAHYGKEAVLRQWTDRFVRLVQAGPETAAALEPAAAQCFRGLRRLGLKDEIGRMLTAMTNALPADGARNGGRAGRGGAKGGAVGGVRPVTAARWAAHVAAGWLHFGREDQAWPLVERVRADLFA
ncbi:MAG: hypothetical protein ACRDD1_04085, partial [Planctomycetia bacterium]